MKKRLFALAITLIMVVGLLPTAFAAGGFPDVTDAAVSRDAETLRLMGVMEGDPSGAFRPNDSLTRAQFCKMAIVLLGQEESARSSATRTIFPDVRSSHWACGFVNAAVSGERAFIRGLPDGTFAPDREITYGEAATILMRLLGYTDADADGLWPQGYLNLASAAGLGEGLSLSASAPILRAQAARLFVQLLSCRTKDGALYTADGRFKRAEKESTLYSVNSGKMLTSADVNAYDMAKPLSTTLFDGIKGTVLFDKNGKALTFLPESGGTAIASSAAVMIRRRGSAAGLDAITGGRTDYTIVKNGEPIGAGLLREHDVAIYDAQSNTVYVSDTRVTVYYETCTPSAEEPLTVCALGGTEFSVLPEARQSVAAFKPGESMTLLLTVNGEIAAAAKPGAADVPGNALAFVGADGSTRLICNGKLGKTLSLKSVKSDSDAVMGCIVQVQQREKDRVYLSKRGETGYGDLDVAARKLGTKRISQNALVFDKGEQVFLNTAQTEEIKQVQYAHENAAGEIDILVLRAGAVGVPYYGRAKVTVKEEDIDGNLLPEDKTSDEYIEYKKTGKPIYLGRYFSLFYYENGAEKIISTRRTSFDVEDGDFVEAFYKPDTFLNMTKLTKHANIPASSWIGKRAVNADGRTFTVPENVSCYNADAGLWMKDLDTALAYSANTTIYEKDGVVRIVAVGG